MRALALGMASLLLAGCDETLGGRSGDDTRGREAAFVGSARCAECHAEAAQRWRASHHALAMREATLENVLGDFGGARFDHAGITSTFFARDGRPFVATDGPDGALHDYPVRYTFGVAPLQQYLIELDGGRLQALSIAWDSRPRDRGGQRWFHLYPGENVDHRDPLHWTRRSQNWNHMCGECHTTGFAKNYDAATHTYDSRFTEIGVGCEGCHGPGSLHVAWAKRAPDAKEIASRGLRVRLDERKGAVWQIDARTGNARRSVPRTTSTEIDTCARCHARRATLIDQPARGQPLSDTHIPVLLRAGLYEADGQIRDEVYEDGSFLQSRMYQRGVTCSDCHEPHGAQLRTDRDGVCLQCHASAKYAERTHHFHDPVSPGARCVSCHMPTRTYMGVDVRHDHGFRVPLPAQSVALGTPNACSACHDHQSAEWAAARVRAWYGRDPVASQRYAKALHAARSRSADAEPQLVALLGDSAQPAIARATSAAELASPQSSAALQALERAVEDANPLVRRAALDGLTALPREERWHIGAPRLRDPVRAVRIAAVVLLADAPIAALPDRSAFEAASADYLAAQQRNADQPEAQVDLGNFYAARGDAIAAERAYRSALALDADWVPAYVNLADLLRTLRRDGEGEALLREGLARVPEAAALHHVLGLLKVRARDTSGALESLRRASELAPDEPRYAYVYSVALHDAGRVEEARRVADAALARVRDDRELREWRDRLLSNVAPN